MPYVVRRAGPAMRWLKEMYDSPSEKTIPTTIGISKSGILSFQRPFLKPE